MGFGGSSLSYCASRLPATVMTTSSTLSPLAPPFTVDRAAPRPALNYDPYVPAWPPRPQPSDDSLHRIRPPSPSPPPASPPQPTHGPTTAAAVDALPYYAHGPALARASSGESSSWRNPSLALADPYYPCFSSAAATSAGDASPFYGGRGEGSGGGSGCLGRHAVPSNVPSAVGAQAEGHRGNSAWIEREGTAVIPGYEDSFQQDPSVAPGFLAYDGLQGGWPGKFTEAPSELDQFRYEHLDWLDAGSNAGVPSDMSGRSALAPGGPVRGRYVHSSDMQTYMQGSKRSDGTDPGDFFPATPFFPDVLASSSNTSTSIDKHSLKNVNHVHPVNAYKNSMLHKGDVSISIRPAELSIDLNHRHKENNAAMNRRRDMGMVDSANVNTPVVKTTLPPSMESAKHIFQDYSLAKTAELRTTSLNNSGSAESDHEQHSSERLDENLAEDSPCWKGATSSRHSVSRTFDTLVADYTIADRRIEGLSRRGSDYPKPENQDVALYSSGLRKDRSIVMSSKNHGDDFGGLRKGRSIVMPSKDHGDDFGSKIENVVQIMNKEKASTSVKNDLITGISHLCTDPTQSNSSIFCSLANGHLSLSSKAKSDAANGDTVISGSSSMSSTVGIDAQVLVKTIHNLSELLLSSYHFDATLLKEHDKELLSSAVNNLCMCISRNAVSGGTSLNVFSCSGSYSHRQLSALSQDAPKISGQAKGSDSTGGSTEQSKNRSSCLGKEKVHSLSYNLDADELDNLLSTGGDRSLQKLLGKVMNEKIYQQGENPQAALYENLWSDVEDAVCLLSSRLQLLRSNVFEGIHKHQLTKASQLEASNMLKSSSENAKTDIVGENMRPWKSTDSMLKNSSTQGKHENVTSLQNHLQMIQENFKKTQQMTGNDFRTPIETLSSSFDSKVEDVDASVMARYKVLQRRTERHDQIDSLNILNSSGAYEDICCPPCLPDGKIDSAMDFPPANNAMPLGWGHHRLLHTGNTEGEAGGSSNLQHHVADYAEGLCLDSHFSERRTVEGFCGQDASALVSQSYLPDSSRSGKHFRTSIHDSSSDWEHVLEDELTW